MTAHYVKICRKQILTAFVLIFGLTVSGFGGNGPTPLINEIVVNPNGSDSNCEYIEFIGQPNGSLAGLYFVSMEGDSGSNEGAADFVADLTAGVLGTNGLLVIAGEDPGGTCDGRDYGAPSGTLVFRTSILGGSGGLENGTNSWLLIRSPTTAITPGTDYDTDDNGSLEALPGDAVIIDSIGWSDGGGADIVYGSVNLPATAGGTPDMATRFPGNTDGNSAAAWYYGDMDGEANSLNYDLTQVSANFPAGGMLTPGLPNVGMAARAPANVDFDGDGTSDYSVNRDETGAGLSDGGSEFFRARTVREKMRLQLQMLKGEKALPEGMAPGTTNVWYIRQSQSGNVQIAPFGTAATDFFVPEDYDGDGQDDLAVWRGTSQTTATFFIFQSSNSTIRQEMFGQIGDDPSVVGDYDGDNTADVAVYRCPPTPGQCFYFYRGSDNNPNGDITFVPWGFGQILDLAPNPGDYDGDGRYDFCIHGADPNNAQQGQFALLNSGNGSTEFINWGLPNDVIVPGDFDGDGMADFMVRRTGSDPFEWYLLERDGGGTGASPIFWGTAGDLETPGDYDGDGSQDIAVWRPGNGPDDNFFYVRRSSDVMLEIFEWGGPQDAPVANWYVH